MNNPKQQSIRTYQNAIESCASNLSDTSMIGYEWELATMTFVIGLIYERSWDEVGDDLKKEKNL